MKKVYLPRRHILENYTENTRVSGVVTHNACVIHEYQLKTHVVYVKMIHHMVKM